jgi:hypothetical protein
MIVHKLRLFITIFLFGLMLQAQEVRTIAKEEVTSRVKENNQKLKISEQEFFEARADYRQYAPKLLLLLFPIMLF